MPPVKANPGWICERHVSRVLELVGILFSVTTWLLAGGEQPGRANAPSDTKLIMTAVTAVVGGGVE